MPEEVAYTMTLNDLISSKMEAPAENGRLLRSMNITLTAGQRKYLMVLEHTGQIAKAQTFIFQELATKGYEGAAKAAANSDPLFRYNKALYELGIEVGHAGIAIEEAFAPALEDAIGWLKTAGQFVSENKDLVVGLVEAVAGAAIAYGAYLAVLKGVATYQFVVNTYQATANTLSELSIAFDMARAESLGVVKAAQWALNVAMEANPIGAIIAGVGLLVGLLSAAYGFWHGMFGSNRKVEIEHRLAFDTANGQSNLDEFSDNIGTAGNSAYGFANTMVSASKKVSDQMNNLQSEAFHVKGLNADKLASISSYWQGGLEGILKRQAAGEQHAAALAHATAAGFIPFALMQKPVIKSTMSTMGKKGGSLLGMQGDVKGDNEPTSKATGSKVLTFNIHIGALVKEMKIQTTNFKEGANKAQAMVTEALLSAVNDSQLATDR